MGKKKSSIKMNSSESDWHLRHTIIGNPIIFFDVMIGDNKAERIKIELWKDICPKTAENFRQFCTGEFRRNGQPIGYKGCVFHRVIKNFIIQSGDFIKQDGTGNMSIYGTRFDDENSMGKHTGPGLLSMANSGPNTNGCQFFITCSESGWLDGKHTVFGRVLGDGMLTVRRIENVPVGSNNNPRMKVLITE